MSRGKTILITGSGLILAAMAYLFALGWCFRWEERATTKAEFIRRVKVRNQVYAPVAWLKAHDPSGGIRAIVQWRYQANHNPNFDPDTLERNEIVLAGP